MDMQVQISCPICLAGDKKVGISIKHGMIVHRLPDRVYPGGVEGRYLGLATLKEEGTLAEVDGVKRWKVCPDWDREFRHVSEPFGFFIFAWWPKLCRNGQKRWLVSVERHADGTYTLGDRAR